MIEDEKERGQYLDGKIVEIKTRYRQLIVDKLFLWQLLEYLYE